MSSPVPGPGLGPVLAVVIPPEAAGQRLDRALAEALVQLQPDDPPSRSRLKVLIEAGQVARSGGATVAEPSTKVKAGEAWSVTLPPPVPDAPLPQALALDVVYEDADLIVIDKPPGLVVHPAPGNPDGTLVNALLAHCAGALSGIGGVERPGIVHRLDKDTSGLLVAAKSMRAHAALARQFAVHDIERAYQAVVWGVPRPAAGRLDGPIGRNPADRKTMAVVPGGKPAVTHYSTLQRFGDAAALVECRLETGRTHQIRVHLTASGHPLVGDPAYRRGGRAGAGRNPALAAAVAGFERQALHAAVLGFHHPDGRWLAFTRPPPADFAALVERLRQWTAGALRPA